MTKSISWSVLGAEKTLWGGRQWETLNARECGGVQGGWRPAPAQQPTAFSSSDILLFLLSTLLPTFIQICIKRNLPVRTLVLKCALSAIMVTCAFELLLLATLFSDEGKTLRFVYYYIRFLEIHSGFRFFFFMKSWKSPDPLRFLDRKRTKMKRSEKVHMWWAQMPACASRVLTDFILSFFS